MSRLVMSAAVEAIVLVLLSSLLLAFPTSPSVSTAVAVVLLVCTAVLLALIAYGKKGFSTLFQAAGVCEACGKK